MLSRPKPRKPSVSSLTFHGAIVRGVESEVVRQIQSGDWNLRDKDDEAFCPFDVAVEARRWGVALALWRHRHHNEHFLPEADTVPEGREPSPLACTTRSGVALRTLLDGLARHRGRRPLPKATMAELDALFDAVADTDPTPEVSVFRAATYGPEWAPWLGRALAKGRVAPNAHLMDPQSGAVVHLLGLAAARGHGSWVEALLDAGANPTWKNHQGRNAAHLAANLAQWTVRDDGAVDLPIVEARLACFERLMALPGVADQRDLGDQRPADVKARGMEWLLAQPLPRLGADRSWTEATLADYKARLHDLVLPRVDAVPAPRRPRM